MSVATAADPPEENRMKHGKPVTMTRTMPPAAALVIVADDADVFIAWLAPGRMAIMGLTPLDNGDEIAHR